MRGQGRREAHNTFPERWSAAAGHRHNNQCGRVVTCQSIAVNPVGFLRYTQSKMESRTVRFWNIKSTHHRRVLSPAGYCPAFEPHGSPVGAVCGQTKRVSQPGEGMSPPDLGGRPAAIQIRIRACFGASIIKLAPSPSTAQLWRVRSPGKVRW